MNDELGVYCKPYERSVTQVNRFETLRPRVIAERVQDIATVGPETNLAVDFGLFTENDSGLGCVTS
jgi:hypothetical protein